MMTKLNGFHSQLLVDLSGKLLAKVFFHRQPVITFGHIGDENLFIAGSLIAAPARLSFCHGKHILPINVVATVLS